MAVITSDFLSGMFTNFRVIWENAFLAASQGLQYERFATVVPSDTDSETYAWLGTVPKMREWTDTRALNSLANYSYTLRNKHFEVTIEVDRDTYEDDKYGMIRPRIAQLGQEAARYPAELVSTVLAAGGSNPGYDGANFFSASHSEESSGTQANTIAGTGVTLAAIRADFISARTAMRRFKDGKGRVMGLSPDLVVIPAELEDVFQQLMNTTIIALGSGTQQSNVLQGAADVVVDPYLTDANDWYVMHTRNEIKPLIFQRRKPPEFVGIDKPDDHHVFMQRKFLYGVDARFNVGYGLWQMAVRVTN